jgi:hypothetical protein
MNCTVRAYWKQSQLGVTGNIWGRIEEGNEMNISKPLGQVDCKMISKRKKKDDRKGLQVI